MKLIVLAFLKGVFFTYTETKAREKPNSNSHNFTCVYSKKSTNYVTKKMSKE